MCEQNNFHHCWIHGKVTYTAPIYQDPSRYLYFVTNYAKNWANNYNHAVVRVGLGIEYLGRQFREKAVRHKTPQVGKGCSLEVCRCTMFFLFPVVTFLSFSDDFIDVIIDGSVPLSQRVSFIALIFAPGSLVYLLVILSIL